MFKAFLKLPLLLLCFLLTMSSLASAPAASFFDLVFDLDWTLVYPVDKNVNAETIVLPQGRFHLADGVPETLLKLHRQGHRISIFSGGVVVRNRALAEILVHKIHALGGTDFSFYKVLNFEDLSQRPGASKDSKFADRWMKDLRKVNTDLRRVVLIDDMIKFSPAGQGKNMYWLAKTYNFHKAFDRHAKGDFDPPTKTAWRTERNKIPLFFENFQKAQKHFSNEEVLPALQDLSLGKSICPRIF